ncbi:zincin-like metallopeptidase domain-containing protein [Massilia sp. TSP1-1-2]|uniref:zincin-like metallopeptidase domain-containing protein n=1 Tax=Massilia sp. TSP1-1-2 TaxID=2804649 RepID=UPI003CF32D5B
MENEKKPFHETVAEKLIEQLKQGTAPWQKPWEPGEAGANMPVNPTTGKRYKGINALQLMSEGREDQRWMTYKQAAAVDAQVRKGEKGTPIQYWKFSEDQNKTDAAGKPILDGRGEPIKETVKLERPRVFFATVFNAEQIDGLPPHQPRPTQAWNAVERAEQIMQASGATIRHGEHDRAFYRQSSDSIHLPKKDQFATADNYYATALHELGHWTGHGTRLDRDMVHPFGSEGYAKEELRAEIASMILGDELGIGHDPEQHAAYVGSWIKALEDDPLEIFRAAADAEKIQEYIMGLEQKQVQEQAAAQASAQEPQPVAYLDLEGVVRAGDHTELPADWHGVIKEEGEFWQVGPVAADGNRTFILLAATTLGEAEVEGIRAQGLAADITDVIAAPESAYSTFQVFDKEELADTLRRYQFNTVRDVTGHDPAQFLETALAKLSPVFGIEVDHAAVADPAYIERQGLAQEFANKAEQLMMPLKQQAMKAEMGIPKQPVVLQAGADRAEAWTLARIEKDSLARAMDGASQAQLKRIESVLDDMEPLSADNPFWQRNKLPQDLAALGEKIESAKELVTVRQADAIVAAARLDLVTGQAFGRERAGDGATLDREAEDNLGFTLPHNWTGLVQVQGNIKRDIDGEMIVLPAANRGEKPEFWGVYAQLRDGSHEHLADRPTELQADELAERLAVIDARSTISEHEKAAKLARVNEERVRRNPDSTDEDISAAKDARKNAEFAATTNDADLQRRIEFEERQRSQQAAPAEARQDAPKNLIAVPYKEKEEAKALGAKWDRKEQSWYVPQNVDPAPFAKWAQQPAKTVAVEAQAPATPSGKAAVSKAVEGRVYLAVPYSDRTEAKAAGAEWDKAAKSWYAGQKADMAKLDKWKPENVPVQQGPAMTPREEFADALRSIGCVVPAGSKHPIMDGEKHRVSVEGEKFSEKSGSGFYVGHMDGHPAGYMKNNRTGTDLTWKAKGYTFDPEQKALLAAEAAQKLQQREADLSKQQEQAAKRVGKELSKLVPVAVATPYMQVKGIEPHAGALTDKDGKKTYVPAIDVDGKHWTTQYIKEDGTKRFAKDSKKEGCFHVVGGMAELAKAPAIVIGEGYATAASLKQSLGFATVSAFDSGNLAAVAQALHQKFPDKPVVIAGDDDRHLEATQGANPGRSKAEEAAKLVGGMLMMPIFSPGENSYPAGLEPVTPDQYREHQRTGKVLSDEQMEALAQMKQFTDFNDLANKSVLGAEGIDRQVRSLVESVIEKHQAALSQSEQQQHEQQHEQQQDRSATVELKKVQQSQQAAAAAPKRRRAAKVA